MMMGPLVLVFSFQFFGGCDEWRNESFVEAEEVFDALAVVVEWLRAVAEINCAVQFGVGFD
jgi:hypothetical protein